MMHRLRRPFKRRSREIFWALRDVSFDVKIGEVVGLIGRNGAGKSTLLKILSRITEPTAGHVDLYGRVSSLLEVGTGFHPELTGRENIFLNGAILGMSKTEIRKQFDAIVDFAGIEKFLDTPVKRYSSGMYVRLAFAVAAHLETEILLVDEVLAVGDAMFQQKCLGKMQEVASRGRRTVLFVSHNMGAMSRLCGSAILVESGSVRLAGPTAHVISEYLAHNSRVTGEYLSPTVTIGNDHKIALCSVRILDDQLRTSSVVDRQRNTYVEVEYQVNLRINNARLAVRLLASDGTVVFTSTDSPSWERCGGVREPGRYISRCEIPGELLNDGSYGITVAADVPGVAVLFNEESVLTFRVENTDGRRSPVLEQWPGVICPALRWEVRNLNCEAGQDGQIGCVDSSLSV
jgi:lipopolysaccharide transport system ATP-binding protein